MSLSLELISPDDKLHSYDTLLSVMAFQQYRCLLLRLIHKLKCVSVSAMISTGKFRLSTRVLLCLARIGRNASELFDGTGTVTSRSGMQRLAWTSRNPYRGTGFQL